MKLCTNVVTLKILSKHKQEMKIIVTNITKYPKYMSYLVISIKNNADKILPQLQIWFDLLGPLGFSWTSTVHISRLQDRLVEQVSANLLFFLKQRPNPLQDEAAQTTHLITLSTLTI